MNLSLYDIDEQIRAVLESADENGEIDVAAFDGLQLAKKDKQLSMIKYISYLNDAEKTIKEHLQRLRKMKEASKKRAQWLKDYLKASMIADGTKTLDFKVFKAMVGKSVPSVVIEDIEKIPEKYILLTVTKDPMKEKILEAFRNGEKVPGCRREQKDRITIK